MRVVGGREWELGEFKSMVYFDTIVRNAPNSACLLFTTHLLSCAVRAPKVTGLEVPSGPTEDNSRDSYGSRKAKKREGAS